MNQAPGPNQDSSASPATPAPTLAMEAATRESGPRLSERGGGALVVELGERPGDLLGPYRLMERLGEGGFGVVWLAEQTAPVRRRVALKIIKPGMDSASVIARFEGERQALAVLDHPGIAKVFDAGATPAALGLRPYFVMEYVRGVPITQYADERRLTIPQRLELFARVCDAVFHAHTKGIIHRDLKPSNILVTVAEGSGGGGEASRPLSRGAGRESGAPSSGGAIEGQPKIIDFGVAKAVQERLTSEALQTEMGVLIGTPEYMSPEQAELTSQDIDTRADVYSLGVVLYELLTGSRPRAGLRPSGSRGGRGGSAGIGSGDGPGEAGGRALIQGPSDETPRPSVMLRRSPEHLEAVAAARGAKPGELTRALRGELEWIPLKALRVDRAERYRSAAEFADDVRNFLAGRPLIAGPESTLYRIRKFLRRHRGPVAAGALGALVVAGGVAWLSVLYAETRVQRNLAEGRARDARASLEFLQSVFLNLDPSRAQGPDITLREVLDQVSPQGQALATAALEGRWAEADARASVGMGAGGESEPPGPEPAAVITDMLASAYFKVGDFASAEKLWASSVAAAERAWGADDPRTLGAIDNRARAMLQLDRLDEAQALNARALEGRARVLGEAHPDTLATRSIGARLQQVRGDLTGAEAAIRGLIAAQSVSGGPATRETLETRNNLADILHIQGKFAEAAAEAHAIAAVAKQVLGEADPVTLDALSLESSALIDAGQRAKGIALLRDILDLRRRTYGPLHSATFISENSLALVLSEEKHYDEALALQESLAQRSAQRLGPDHSTTLTYMNNLARTYAAAGKVEEAERTFRDTLERRKRVSGADSVDTLALEVNFAVFLHEQKKQAGEALPLLLSARDGLDRALPGHWMVWVTDGLIADALRDLKRYDEALARGLRAYTGLHSTLGPQHARTRIAADSVWAIYEAMGVPAQVKAWKKLAGRE